MSANDPYSRDETDLKLINVEQRLENKLDRVLAAIEILSINSGKDFAWLIKVVMALGLMILGIIMAAAIKWFLH